MHNRSKLVDRNKICLKNHCHTKLWRIIEFSRDWKLWSSICLIKKKQNKNTQKQNQKRPLRWSLWKMLAILCFIWKERRILNYYRYIIVSFQKHQTEDLLVTHKDIVSSIYFCFSVTHSQNPFNWFWWKFRSYSR